MSGCEVDVMNPFIVADDLYSDYESQRMISLNFETSSLKKIRLELPADVPVNVCFKRYGKIVWVPDDEVKKKLQFLYNSMSLSIDDTRPIRRVVTNMTKIIVVI